MRTLIQCTWHSLFGHNMGIDHNILMNMRYTQTSASAVMCLQFENLHIVISNQQIQHLKTDNDLPVSAAWKPSYSHPCSTWIQHLKIVNDLPVSAAWQVIVCLQVLNWLIGD